MSALEQRAAGVQDTVKLRWRRDALLLQRLYALDRPMPSEAIVRYEVALLATYVLCLTIDMQEPGEVERHWGLPAELPDIPSPPQPDPDDWDDIF